MKRLFYLLTFVFVFTFSVKASHFDSIDVVHYEITLEITDFANQMIYGYTELKIVPKILPLDAINLDLLEMIIDSVMVNDQKVVNIQYDDRTLQIPLQPAATTYDTITVVVYYFGHPQEDPGPNKWGGFKWTANSAFNLGVGFQAIPHCFGRAWFPCNDDFEDRATYTFNILTNAALNHWAVCNGHLKSYSNNCSGKRVCRWEMTDPIPTYLASVAVGEYVCLRDTFNGMLGAVPIEIWVNLSDTLKARNSFVNLKNILQLFESKFGPYRWQKVGYVSVDFNSGAMEHATNIAYPKLAINGNTAYETLYAHELFHHWFGNLVTCRTAEDMWINEGWARFSEFLHDETYSGIATFLQNKRTMLHDVLRYAHIEDSGFYALNNIPQFNTYGKTAYDKGALIVLNLRQFLGDSLFYAVMTQFLNEKAFQPVSSEDMRDFLVQHANPAVADFFNTYVFTPGFPHFSVDSFTVKPVGQQWEVVIFSKEKLRHRNTYSSFAKSRATLMGQNWDMQTVDIHLHNGYGVDTVYCSFNPVTILTDLFEEINDASTGEYKTIKTTGNVSFDKTYFTSQVMQVVDSSFLRVEHHWVAPDGFKNPIPGLVLSKDRYWEVNGMLNQQTVIKGKFQYLRSSTPNSSMLDQNLITGSIDSLVLLYRPNRASDWQLVPFSRFGTPYTGYLVVDTLKLGEYAFGYWNWEQWISVPQAQYSKQEIIIVPNPASNECMVYYAFEPNSSLEVLNTKGQTELKTKIHQSVDSCSISLSSLKQGIYIVKIHSASGKTAFSKLLIHR